MLVGGFVFDTIASYPSDIRQGVAESREEARQYMEAGSDAIQQLGQIAMQARPELPQFKDMLNPHAWANAAKESSKKFTGAFGDLENQLLSAYEDIESEFCTPPAFLPHKKLPGKIWMPSFYIEAGLGNCTVTNTTEVSDLSHGDAFNCTKPYVTTVHKPGKWVSKHHAAIEFKSKECKKEKEFGEDEVIVLFEFNGHDALDLDRARGLISSAFGGLQQGVGALTGQVEDFVAGLKDLGSLKNKLGSLAGTYGSIPAAY